MERADLKRFDLPDVPGVYLFKRGREVLYVGKATSLRDRVRSYFDDDLIATRGPRIVDMVTKANSMIYHTTPTVLEALVVEASLIRKYRPMANAEGKDDKTFLYACITSEEIPRVLAIRGSSLDFKAKRTHDGQKLKALYGPFPSGLQLREGLRLIRKIFPFFDTPNPVKAQSAHGARPNRHHDARVEFYTQIGAYPKQIDKKAYRRSIRNIELFLSGRTKELRTKLNKEMREAVKAERFEEAAGARNQLFALDHIQDVSLIKDENLATLRQAQGQFSQGRIEAYDTAHLAGTNAVGVMVVVEDGAPIKKEYRTFNIRGVQKNDDIASLKELIRRRFGHLEWPYPNALVVDGGKTQKKAAEEVLAGLGIEIPVAAVVKDERHRPREVLGARRAGVAEADAVLANAEAHRFSLARHRRARTRELRSK